MAHALVTAADFSAYELKCEECGTKFEFTAGNQAFYKERNVEKPPRRCEKFNKANVARMGRIQCNKFDRTGKCSYGSKCRFKHGDTVMCVTDDTVMCAEEPEQDDAVVSKGEVYSEGSDFDSDEDKPWRK